MEKAQDSWDSFIQVTAYVMVSHARIAIGNTSMMFVLLGAT